MRDRDFTLLAVATLEVLTLLWVPVLMAQAPSGTKQFDPTTTNTDAAIKAAAESAKRTSAIASWTPPRTAWGDPDLQGYWLTAT